VRTVEDALFVAERVSRLPHLRLRGVMGYEGHVVLEPDRAVRAELALAAMHELAHYVERLRAAGFDVEIVSAGGSTTHDMTGLCPEVTELQAGTYAVMDTGYASLSSRFEPCLSVAATVISRQGLRAVLDCGTKVLCPEVSMPTLPEGCGEVRELHEEHALVDLPDGSGVAVGDRLELRVGYSGGTINLHDFYHVVDGDFVVDVWGIVARGAGWWSSGSLEGGMA
jgi:D-serine deaminase-like pyridoxal phosphate-dependent protein